jgi:hypothetical protein
MSLFDGWCFDAFVRKSWEPNQYDFFAGGPPVETPPACVAEIRAYLEACRRPGTSTHVVLALPDGVDADCVEWRLDGAPVARPAYNGPEGAGGSWDESGSSWKRSHAYRWERVLVTPGEHRASVTVHRAREVEAAVSVRRGCRADLILDPFAGA